MFEDIVSEVRTNAQGKKVQTLANEVWDQSCYRLDKYRLDGRTVTQGEAFLEWCLRGWDVHQCRWEWRQRAVWCERAGGEEGKTTWKKDRAEECLKSRLQERQRQPDKPREQLQNERMREVYKFGYQRNSAKRPAGGRYPSHKKPRGGA